MAKDKKEKREERMKKKAVLKVKPEKKFKKRKIVSEAGVNCATDEIEHAPMVIKDTEGLKSGKSGKNSLTTIKKKKLKEKRISKLKSSLEGNNEERISAKKEEKAVSPGNDLGNQEESNSVTKKKTSNELGNQEESNSVTKKKTKKGKKNGKGNISEKPNIQSNPEKQDPEEKNSKEISEIDVENAEEISSVDEDCSRGMKKWLLEYRESRPGIEVLQERIDDFIDAHEAQLEQEKEEREAAVAEGGWTVVVHHKGRKKTTDAVSGIAVGSVAQAALLDKTSKKKSKEVAVNFYRFQKRDAQRKEVMMLQEKFEQDRKRIQQLRAARKFRPY